MRPVVIVAPNYSHQSNGVRGLHYLGHTINALGHIARLLILARDKIVGAGAADQLLNPDWDTPLLKEEERGLLDEAIIIYPEVVYGNPLDAKRVARWLGNKEGVLRSGQGMNAGRYDFLFAHSKVIRKDAHHILYYAYQNPCFNDIGADPDKRILNATYIGKGYMYGKVGPITDKAGLTLEIDREWPRTQEQLAILLKHIACFYTWDCWSATNVDAIMCGAVPFFLNYSPFSSEEIDSSEIGRIPRLDADNREFNLEKFQVERIQLKARLTTLHASWDDRVRHFLAKMERHFA